MFFYLPASLKRLIQFLFWVPLLISSQDALSEVDGQTLFSNLDFKSTSKFYGLENGVGMLQSEPEMWSLHGQSTYIIQQKNNFNSAYHGQNSLLNKNEGAGENSYTFSATAFLGRRLWQGGELFFNPEIFQGIPFSGQLVGLGGFENGELQKGAFDNPVYYTARAFIRQTINLGGESEISEEGPNKLKGSLDKNRLVLTFGKLASLDYFDDNTYSHDPRAQFQNFAIFSMGAYGYAADIKGFTYGAVAEWYRDNWVIKIARLALPEVPNTSQLDYSLTKDYINQIEATRIHRLGEQSGAIRALLYRQYAFMANYQDAINSNAGSAGAPDLTAFRRHGSSSIGYGMNLEQSINENLGVFGRWSWNTGATETQTLDISKSISGGVSLKGSYWASPKDTVGLGYAINGISSSEINYLKLGGMTAFIGDGNISYKPETVIECYYSKPLSKEVSLTLDLQRITNPAYNSDRGPVNMVGFRVHFEI